MKNRMYLTFMIEDLTIEDDSDKDRVIYHSSDIQKAVLKLLDLTIAYAEAEVSTDPSDKMMYEHGQETMAALRAIDRFSDPMEILCELRRIAIYYWDANRPYELKAEFLPDDPNQNSIIHETRTIATDVLTSRRLMKEPPDTERGRLYHLVAIQ